MKPEKYDFGGYATKANIRCTDGRTIKPDSFKHQDGTTVPLVFQHGRDSLENIIGNAVLENRPDGVYAYCTFNGTPNGQIAKSIVQHGDLNSLSIFANQLVQNGREVVHGKINEVSLVVAGANSGARIDNVIIEHSDGSGDYDLVPDEAIMYFDELLEHSESSIENQNGGEPEVSEEKKTEEKQLEHEVSSKDKTVKEIFDTLNDEQKEVVYAMLGYALSEDEDEDDEAEQSDDDDDSLEHTEGGDQVVKKNIFEGADGTTMSLSHEDQAVIFKNASRSGSLKDTVLQHGITNIDILFPEAKNLNTTPFMIARDQEWVANVWNGTRKSPFARIRSTAANLTEDEARARGYIKGKKKVDEQFSLLKRTTTPQTIYKKQSFDQDDIIDITDFDVVAWVKAEMRMMLNEELARAVLVGDGRLNSSDDKISEDHIRSIYHDDDLYAIHYIVDQSQTTAMDRSNAIVDDAHRARKTYKGSGSMTFYTDTDTLTDLLLTRDKDGRRIYATMAELASAMGVKEIVEVPVMAGLTREVTEGEGTSAKTKTLKLLGIMVNLIDYVIGADKGGAVSMFDDFDIDYNKQKYLMETRVSGALQNPYSAVVLEADVTPSAG